MHLGESFLKSFLGCRAIVDDLMFFVKEATHLCKKLIRCERKNPLVGKSAATDGVTTHERIFLKGTEATLLIEFAVGAVLEHVGLEPLKNLVVSLSIVDDILNDCHHILHRVSESLHGDISSRVSHIAAVVCRKVVKFLGNLVMTLCGGAKVGKIIQSERKLRILLAVDVEHIFEVEQTISLILLVEDVNPGSFSKS